MRTGISPLALGNPFGTGRAGPTLATTQTCRAAVAYTRPQRCVTKLQKQNRKTLHFSGSKSPKFCGREICMHVGWLTLASLRAHESSPHAPPAMPSAPPVSARIRPATPPTRALLSNHVVAMNAARACTLSLQRCHANNCTEVVAEKRGTWARVPPSDHRLHYIRSHDSKVHVLSLSDSCSRSVSSCTEPRVAASSSCACCSCASIRSR